MTMDYKQEQTGVSVWKLFERQPTRADYEALRLYAQKSAAAFEGRFIFNLNAIDQDFTRFGKNVDLDKWADSAEGMSALVGVARDLQKRIRQYGGAALPAHDLRQILYKDATEGLRFSIYEQPQGYKASFIVPMFSHDIGRLLEGHFYPLHLPHDDWIPHSQLSFLMMREVLDAHPEVPQALKEHFMYAVLAHSGQNAKTYIGQAVQTCDRMQLIGPEGYFRSISYVAGMMGGTIAYPRTTEYQLHPPTLEAHDSAVAVLEHFGRNGYPNIGDHHYEWQERMQTLNTAILLRMCEHSYDLGEYMLSPELGVVPHSALGPNKKKLDLIKAMEVTQRLPANTNLHFSRQDIYEYMVRVLENPVGAAALTDNMKANIRDALMRLKDDELEYVQHGMLYAEALKDQLDQEDDFLIRTILKSEESSPLQKIIAREAVAFSNPEPVSGMRSDTHVGFHRSPA